MVVTTTGQILALLSVAFGAQLLSRVLRLELTLACLICGFLFGMALETIDFDTGLRATNLQDIVFFIILPVLIFEAAWELKLPLLRRWLVPSLLLATIGVLIGCFVNAALLYLGIGNPEGFPWIAALLTGAILAATDPIAVISQLREQNAPEDLRVLFEGESLFNDATAIVLFGLFLSMALGTAEAGVGGVATYFLATFFGGLVVGVVCGLVITALARLFGSASSTNPLLVSAAFGSFYVAEHLLHVSGIMAVVAAALVARWALAQVPEELTDGVEVTWGWLGQLFTTVLFVIMGLVITLDMFVDQWLAMLIAVPVALVARASAVVLCGAMTTPLQSRISVGWQILLFWGGLRGAIAIALVLSLPVELPYWYTVQSMVFAVVLFSLLVQGPSNARLVARYGSAGSSQA